MALSGLRAVLYEHTIYIIGGLARISFHNDCTHRVDWTGMFMPMAKMMQRIESIEKVMDENEESEKDVIKRWLMDIVKLAQYYSLFVGNGYDTLRCVAAMKDKSELQEIRITLPGHQT
eukprot:208530_1